MKIKNNSREIDDMNMKDFYLTQISQAMMNEDEQTIVKYEKLLAELEKNEFNLKTKIAKNLKNKENNPCFFIFYKKKVLPFIFNRNSKGEIEYE